MHVQIGRIHLVNYRFNIYIWNNTLYDTRIQRGQMFLLMSIGIVWVGCVDTRSRHACT